MSHRLQLPLQILDRLPHFSLLEVPSKGLPPIFCAFALTSSSLQQSASALYGAEVRLPLTSQLSLSFRLPRPPLLTLRSCLYLRNKRLHYIWITSSKREEQVPPDYRRLKLPPPLPIVWWRWDWFAFGKQLDNILEKGAPLAKAHPPYFFGGVGTNHDRNTLGERGVTTISWLLEGRVSSRSYVLIPSYFY